MELKPDALISQLGKAPLKPAYLVAGVEPLGMMEMADAVRARARSEGFGREVFDIEREADWEDVAAALASMGLFSQQRLLDVRLPGGKPGKAGEALILEFCRQPPAGITLLVVAGDWSKKHAGKWSDAIRDAGQLAVAWAVKPHELGDWVERRLRSRGLKAEREAVMQLAARVEGNLLAAAQEVDKLALLAAPGQVLDVAAMQDLVADAARFDVFRLTDVMLKGEAAQGVRILAGLRAEGEAVPALLGMVVRELQMLERLARVESGGGNLHAEFRSLHVWEARQALYLRALQRHPASRWARFLSLAGRIDRAAKGRGEGDPWLLLERLLLAIAEPRALRLLAA